MRRDGRPLALIAILAAPSLLARGVRGAGRSGDGQPQSVARAHHRRGERLYVAARYAEALAEFEAGFAAIPLPGFLVNIGQCHRRMGDLEPARVAFGRFLTLAPDSALAREVRGLVRELTLAPLPLDVAAAARSKPAPPPAA